MFTTDKRANPFLKPSPVFGQNHNYQAAYSSPNNYNNYMPTDAKSYKNDYRVSPIKTSQPYVHSKYAQEKSNFDQILNKNPFTRSNPIGFTSRPQYNQIKSPYVTNPTYEQMAKNLTKQSYGNYDNNYNQNGASRFTPPKRYDNYLTTSSADSTGTYINKIYEIDEDKYSNVQLKANPFHRKNLITEKNNLQLRPNNQYSKVSYNYMQPQRDYGIQKPLARENTFLKHQDYDKIIPSSYDYETKIDDAQVRSKNYDDLTYKKGKYEEYEQKYDYTNVPGSYEKYTTEDYVAKEDPYEKYTKKYEIKDKKDAVVAYPEYNKYKDYKEQEPSFNYSKKSLNESSKHPHPHQMYQQEGQNYKSKGDSKGSKPQKSSLKYGLQNSQKFDFQQEKDEQRNYGNDLYLNKLKENKIQSKVNFNQNDSSQYESKRYQQDQQYPASGFQTLGGKRPHTQENNHPHYNQQYANSKKFISSQVQEYQQKAKSKEAENYRPHKEYDVYESKKGIRSEHKILTFAQNQEANLYEKVKQKKPVRDNAPPEQYPKVLQLNGIMFHRIQIR